MVGLVPFVILCIILAVVIIALFAMWHRRDIRKGDPWDADKAAKIYVGLIAGFLVAALGLASTPVVRLDAEAAEASEPPSESTSVLPTSTSEAATESPTDSVVAAGTGEEIVLTENHGVDLDTTDRVLLPTDGTPGIDIALYGSPYLYSPAGEVFERTTTEPGESTCGNASDNDTYSDFAVDQWYCFTTSEGVAGSLHITNVVNKSSGAEVTVRVELFESPPSDDDDSSGAETTGEVTLREYHGVDLDTTDRALLPTDGTPGIDIALYGSPYLYTPDGTSFVRATTKPTRQHCDAIADTNTYRDFATDQWYCFTTSDGVTGYLHVTDVTDKSSGAEVEVEYFLFGDPQVTPGEDSEIDGASAGDIVLTEDHGIDLDTTDRALLPTDGTPGIDIALYGSPYLYTPDGTSFVRATTKPTRQHCDAIADTNTYRDFATDQWYCFTTSDGVAGRMQVTQVSDRSDSTEAAISYALFR